jgi:hypothetical protein
LTQVNPDDSDDFFESDSFEDLGNNLAVLPNGPQPPKIVLKPGEVDFFDDSQGGEFLARAMSVLSVSSTAAPHIPEVIVLSD